MFNLIKSFDSLFLVSVYKFYFCFAWAVVGSVNFLDMSDLQKFILVADVANTGYEGVSDLDDKVTKRSYGWHFEGLVINFDSSLEKTETWSWSPIPQSICWNYFSEFITRESQQFSFVAKNARVNVLWHRIVSFEKSCHNVSEQGSMTPYIAKKEKGPFFCEGNEWLPKLLNGLL